MVTGNEGSRRGACHDLSSPFGAESRSERDKRKQGRSALSFAAVPFGQRPTSSEALRVLLESGADSEKVDDSRQTVETRAQREDRGDAMEVFEDFSKRQCLNPWSQDR